MLEPCVAYFNFAKEQLHLTEKSFTPH